MARDVLVPQALVSAKTNNVLKCSCHSELSEQSFRGVLFSDVHMCKRKQSQIPALSSESSGIDNNFLVRLHIYCLALRAKLGYLFLHKLEKKWIRYTCIHKYHYLYINIVLCVKASWHIGMLSKATNFICIPEHWQQSY